MSFTMTFNDGDFLEQIENIKRDESFCLITNKEKAFISKKELIIKGFIIMILIQKNFLQL